MNLPVPLHCITLQHIIDDSDAVEGYLAEHPEAERCFPLIIRDVFFMNPENRLWNLPIRTDIPDASTTLRYLLPLWTENEYDAFVRTGQLGTTYLLPCLVQLYCASRRCDTPPRRLLTETVFAAAASGQTDTLLLAILMGGSIIRGILPDSSKLEWAVDVAASNGHVETTLTLAKYSEDPRRALTAAMKSGHIPVMQAVLEKHPMSAVNIVLLLFHSRGDISESPAKRWLKEYVKTMPR